MIKRHGTQRSPMVLAPGTSFREDSISVDGRWEGDGSGSNVFNDSGGNGSDGKRQMKLRLLASCSRMLCGLVNRQRTAQTLGPWVWGTPVVVDRTLDLIIVIKGPPY